MRWITQNFRNLLVTTLIGLVALLGLPTYLYSTLVHTRQLVDERAQTVHNMAQSAATLLSENLRERSREVALLAQTPLYVRAPLDSPEFRASLERVQNSYPYYSWIGLTDLDGTVRAATGDLLLGQSVAQRPWFQQARQAPAGGLYVGDLHEAKLLAKLLPPSGEGPARFIDFAVQVLDGAGLPRAVLGVHAHWNWSKHLIEVIAPPKTVAEGMEFFIVNRHDEVIFPETPRSAADQIRVPQVAADAPAAFHRWGNETSYLTAASAIQEPPSTVPLGWKILVRQPEAQVLQHATELQQAISTVAGLAVLVFLALAWGLSRWLGHPIHRLTRTAQAIAQGQPAHFNLDLQTTELRQLQTALQQMSTQLLDNQRDLADAAHDLENKVALRTQELADANQALSALARHDTLTGLPNRLAANEFLAHEFQLLKRRPLPYAVLLLDIDHFKRVNDTHGHAVGDAVLRHVGAVLMRSVRESDFIGRVGGEEFMAVLPMTALSDALGVAQKIRAQMEAAPLAPVGAITTSIGVAMAHVDHLSADEAVGQADALLYAAKRAGRNRVVAHPGANA